MEGLDSVTFAFNLLPRSPLKRKVALGGTLAVLLLSAEYHGYVSGACKWIKRSFSSAIAQWLEDQGGFPLFTIEGEEPEDAKHSWDLPSSVSLGKKPMQQGAADAASQLEGNQNDEAANIGSFASPASSSAAELPNFFASTKFFSCLDLKESQELFEATQMVTVAPHETLFQVGDSSDAGIFIVLEGLLGVFLPEGDQLSHTNTLRTGESVGDFDVVDGARRSVTCIALDDGAVLVQVSRELFLHFVAAKPRTLQIYLHKAMARFWRVGHFVLSDFLNLTLEQASSNRLADASNFSAMALLKMPESSLHRPLSQAVAQSELDQLRAANHDKQKPAAASVKPEDPQASANNDSRREESQIGNDLPEESETVDGSNRGDLPTEAEQRTSGEATTSQFTREKEQQGGGKPLSRPPKGVRFQPSLTAVSEASLESEPSTRFEVKTAESPFQAYAGRTASQDSQASSSGGPAAQESLLTAELRKGRHSNDIPESPFATMSQQSSGGSSKDASPDSSIRGGNKAKASISSLTQLEAGEIVGQASGEPGDSEIASSIREAMSQLRAASLPAALVRPPMTTAPATEQNPQGGSPTSTPAGTSPDAPALNSGMSLKASMHLGGQACLSCGWDVISSDECSLSQTLWKRLTATPSKKGSGGRLNLKHGDLLHIKDQLCRHFVVLLKGHLLAERKGKNGKTESGLVTPGSLIGCASFLSSSRNRETIRASQGSTLAIFGPQELEAMMKRSSDCFVELLLAAARALGPVIRRFISLGLNRVWLDSGDTAYRQRESATCLYIIISGRLRLVREDPASRPPVRVEEEVGRGEAVGAVWALAGGYHDTTALCVRDAELVRMSRGAFELIVAQCPLAVAGMLSGMGRRLAAASAIRMHRSLYDPSGRAAVATPVPAAGSLQNGATGGGTAKRGEVVTIALVPAGCQLNEGALTRPPDSSAFAIKKLGGLLKHTLEELFGPTLHLSSSSMELMFPTSFMRLSNTFYRSKITSWMAAQEEDYRFILMEADSEINAWTRICTSQADCILLVGAEDAAPPVNELEQALIWASMGSNLREKSLSFTLGDTGHPSNSSQRYVDAKIYAARMRRVELVLLHAPEAEPKNTNLWLNARTHLARHHHVRLSHSKDLARLARWMAGKAVGLVLSGGGSRGLAHLGVLHALDDAGVPVDVIGGTSQGAFMAGLFAQGLTWEQMHRTVRTYAQQMGSVRHLLSDLTLPIISVFNGRGFDRVIRESFGLGPQSIEDLWLRFFCISTNLSRGEPSVHEQGSLWRLVRASMTIVGLVPPVYHEGELLVDGGYLNNMPVDVMRGLGVDTVVVVDVEDKDASVWRNLSAYDGGISGWQLLWDRWCPIPSLRFGFKLPRYQQIVNHLTWMSHSQNLKRVSREHVIDLYLQPPVGKFRLMDFHLMERLVRDANRYAWGAITEWQLRQGVTQQGMLGIRPLKEAATLRMRRAHSIPCMTQLQIKHSDAYRGETDEASSNEAETSRASTMRPAGAQNRRSHDLLAQIPEAGGLQTESPSRSNSANSTPRDAARPRGLFQIVGPMAIPSATDLAAMDNDPAAVFQSLPSRRLTQGQASSAALNELGTDFASRRPSLEAQLRPIDSDIATSWLPGNIRHGRSKGTGNAMPDFQELPPMPTQLSSSAPAAPIWPAEVGGALALPNHAILPESSRRSHVLPEVRRVSLMEDTSVVGGRSSRAIRGLSSRPSFTEHDWSPKAPNSDDDLDTLAILMRGNTDSESTSSSGNTGAAYSSRRAPQQRARDGRGGSARISSAPHLAYDEQ